jgi:hypothetical protein
VFPPYLKLVSLKEFKANFNVEDNKDQSQSSPSKQMMWKGRSMSIEKTEYDEFIKNGQGLKMLENELKNCIV